MPHGKRSNPAPWQERVAARHEKRRGASTHALEPRGVTGQTREEPAAGSGKDRKDAHDQASAHIEACEPVIDMFASEDGSTTFAPSDAMRSSD